MSDEYRYMKLKLWALLGVLVLCACTKPNPASCLDNFCSDPALPFCDVDGSVGGVPDTCVAVTCTPAEFAGCDGDRALICNTTGDNFDLVDCEFGCGETGCLPCNTTDCEQHLIPKYLPAICDDLATTDLAIESDVAIDTSIDDNCTSVVTQTSGPGICVVHHQSIKIAANQTLTVTGTRALALVADRGLDVDGILDASASGIVNGPAGGFKKSGTGGSVAGGGAGHRTRGGHGGTDTTDGGAVNGGAPEAHPASLAELFGGTQPAPANPGRSPGGGGGALTLISCRGTVAVAGIVDVGGGGGQGGQSPINGTSSQPGGGGAGGNVVLQGLGVVVTGQLFANGGGGGGGGIVVVSPGGPGKDGTRSIVSAAGGSSEQGVGGVGGSFSNGAFDGRSGNGAGGFGGAGGGSAGFLLTYTPQGVVPMLDPLLVSPTFEPNGTVGTN